MCPVCNQFTVCFVTFHELNVTTCIDCYTTAAYASMMIGWLIEFATMV